MQLKKVIEGSVELLIPESEKLTRKIAPFYNPDKEFDRSVSVAFLKAYRSVIERYLEVLDLLTASGVRGLRFACEVDGLKEVILNDINPVAYEVAKENIELNKNKLKCEVKIFKEEANKLLYSLRKKFDYIDVDPFGSPNPFLEASIRSLKRKGILAITSTDVGCLYGAHPMTCLRKYGSLSFQTEYREEAGLRILAKKVIEVGASYDLALSPVFGYASKSYARMYFQLDFGAKRAEKLLHQIGFVLHCKKCLSRKKFSIGEFRDATCEICGSKAIVIGPLYLGELWDQNLCKQMLISSTGKVRTLIERILGECEVSEPLNFTTDSFRDAYGVPELKVELVVRELRRRGFKASRTHFPPKGFRTNAEIKEILNVFKSLAGARSQIPSSHSGRL